MDAPDFSRFAWLATVKTLFWPALLIIAVIVGALLF